MKKLLLLLPIVMLVSAACKSNTSTSVQTPVIDHRSQTQEKTADWQTYIDVEQRFQFKYPAGWDSKELEVHKPLNSYKFDNPPAGTSFIYNRQQEKWTYSGPGQASADEAPQPRVTDSGVKWFYTVIADGLGGAVIALIPDTRNGLMIEIWNGWGSDSNSEDLDKMVDPLDIAKQQLADMISTFQFTAIALKRVCPDAWYDNQMPGINVGGSTSQYLIINGQRAELRDYDMAWIKTNCKVNQPEVVY